MIRPAQLDSKIATRSVDFDEALHLLALSAESSRTYTQLMKLAESRHLIVDRKGRPLKKSSFHRNWKTLEVLGLIRKEKQFHSPTPVGSAVLEAYIAEGMRLGRGTKYLLRQSMQSSKIARDNFFSLFATAQTRGPLDHTGAVALIPRPIGTGSKATREYEIRNIVTGFTYTLTWRQVIGIIWGLGGWAVTLELADQLYARPQDGVPAELSKIAFLVSPDRDASLVMAEFANDIERAVNQTEPIYGETVRMPISKLLYEICPRLQISTATARAALKRWLESNSARAFVEGASQPVLHSTRSTNRSGSRISWQQQEPALLEMDGQYFTYLFCQKSLNPVQRRST